ncbi:hypothetical protein HPB47_010892 [Ixodes persulcatus]|uniref:Uncharacterized protein n=1 Tax=Ixodes persulcatus TaxID=34615 RepID=A0AC60NY25_IXOPE|nr:hypothetical protein HPB47_010892 [Ixodes persulcatus]
MPVACCAPECGHRKRSGPGTQARHFFKVPLDEKRLALWSRNFPWRDLSHKDVLCDLHFREQDILKYFKHEIRGEVVLTPRAIGKEREFEEWSVDISDEHIVFYKTSLNKDIFRIETALIVNTNFNVSVNARGRVVPPQSYLASDHPDFNSAEEVKSLLGYLNGRHICSGYAAQDFPNVVTSKTAVKYEEVWHRTDCTVLADKKICPSCMRLGKLLHQRNKVKTEAQGREPRPKERVLRKKLRQAASRREAPKKELKNLRRQLGTLSKCKVDDAVQKLPAAQRMAFRTALKAVTAKSAKGMRYETDCLMSCMLLRISSPRAYNLVTQMNLLPLPSVSRLQKMLKDAPCQFGFNRLSLVSIAAQLDNKKPLECYGTLLLDEMKVRKALVFNKSTYKLDGLVDYGEEGTTSQEEPADHALVLMFVPLYFDWVQPIASFASKGAAPGNILAKLVLNAIIQLHKHNPFVLAVVSDGAGSNKSMWTKLGISGKFGATCHKLEHPCDPSKLCTFCVTYHIS